MITPVVYDLHWSHWSNSSLSLKLPTKGIMLQTLGNWSFLAAVPALWNNLPSSIRNMKLLTLVLQDAAYSFNSGHLKDNDCFVCLTVTTNFECDF